MYRRQKERVPFESLGTHYLPIIIPNKILCRYINHFSVQRLCKFLQQAQVSAHVFVGSFGATQNKHRLLELGITRILCLSPILPHPYVRSVLLSSYSHVGAGFPRNSLIRASGWRIFQRSIWRNASIFLSRLSKSTYFHAKRERLKLCVKMRWSGRKGFDSLFGW